MNLDEVAYILYEVDWESCIILTNVAGIGGTSFDVVNKNEMSLRHGMLYIQRGDDRSFVSLENILGFKLFDYDKDEHMEQWFKPIGRITKDYDFGGS